MNPYYHLGRFLSHDRNYYCAHRDSIPEQKKEYAQRNKKNIANYKKQYYSKNKEKLKRKHKKYLSKDHIYTIIKYDDGNDIQRIVLDFENNANYAQGLIYKKMLESRNNK